MAESDTEITFRSDVAVELVRSSAQDADVLFAARVSTKGESSLEDVDADASRSQGLINYLMRDRHGCYDDQTDVLTTDGWIPWPQITGRERFITRNQEGVIEEQQALRHIRRSYAGPMVRVQMAHVDLLVTPDHRMLATRRRQAHRERLELVPASDLLEASHRMLMGGGRWEPQAPFTLPTAVAELLGFFVGDGHCAVRGGTPTFRLRKQREISFLEDAAERAGYGLSGEEDRYYLLADEDFRLLAKKCYTDARDKVLPSELAWADVQTLEAVLRGLMASDGSVSPTGKETYYTTSKRLADQIQELACKVGRAATIRRAPVNQMDGHFGTKPLYKLTIYRARNLSPKVGWTTTARKSQVQVEHYEGEIHCVTVPNGTLYVRRNGIPAWCGNSPFEHNSMTFYVQAPIFVFREFMRHRIASYNEESGRYRELRPVFYVPSAERKLIQEGKPGAYRFVDGTPEQSALVEAETKRVCTEAYAAYQRMLEAGIAREVARIVLPVTIYSSMYVTMNARSLMNFLSLRTKREDSTFPSFPQREIEMVAEKMEAFWRGLMPLTAQAFDSNGRVSP
ncbi:MAG: thymidylate synthase [Frankiales bacterium]|nr:thymidylate synthase [Frankiales bacterium]